MAKANPVEAMIDQLMKTLGGTPGVGGSRATEAVFPLATIPKGGGLAAKTHPLAKRGPQMKLEQSLKSRMKGMMGKVGGKLGKSPLGLAGAGGLAFFLPFLLEALTGALNPEVPEVVTAEEGMKGFEMELGLAKMQANLAEQDPSLYTALLQFLSGQAPVTGLAENAVRFGGAKQGEVPDDVVQQALARMMSGGLS